MNALKQNANGILLCLFEAIIGILLMINPVTFTSGIVIACGIILILIGLACIIKYFCMDTQEAVMSQNLLKGLVLLLVGALCALNYKWFFATFSLLTIIYGAMILLAGLGKIQWTVNMLRLKREKWFLMGISAVISIICAIVIIANPFATVTILWQFTGISLIVEAVFDVVSLILNRQKKEIKETETDAADADISL